MHNVRIREEIHYHYYRLCLFFFFLKADGQLNQMSRTLLLLDQTGRSQRRRYWWSWRHSDSYSQREPEHSGSNRSWVWVWVWVSRRRIFLVKDWIDRGRNGGLRESNSSL